MNMRLFLSLAVSSIVIVLPLVGQTATRAMKESAHTKTKAGTLPRTAARRLGV